MHVSSSPAVWYAARASGIAAYVVLTLTVSLGIAMAGKARSTRWPRFATEDIHRFGGLLVGSLIGVHVLAIAADSFLPFSLGQLLVPLTATYRPLWTGLGIAAAELLVALAITNHYRTRLPYRVWRSLHYLNFAVWSAASLHGALAGTDRGAPWLVPVYAVAVALVAALLAWRAAGVALRSPVAAGAALAAFVAVAVLLLGPLQKQPRAWNARKVSEPLRGQVVSNGTSLQRIVSFVGSAAAPQKLLVRADLLVSPQRLDSTSLQLEYLPSGDICRGRVTAVGGTSFAGRCTMPDGERRWVDASWDISDGAFGVTGTITLHA